MNVPDKLFREQAIQHRLKRTRSEVLLQRSALLQPLLWLFCLGFFGLIIVFNNIEYKETLSARGQLVAEGRGQQLPAPGGGVVSEIRIRLGDEVVKGQVVAVLSRTLFDQDGQPHSLTDKKLLVVEYQSMKQEKALLEQTFSTRQDAIEARIEDQGARIHTATAGLALLEQQKDLSASLLSRTTALLDKQSIPAMQVEQQELAHLALMNEVNSAQSLMQELRTARSESLQQLRTLALEKDLAVSRIDAKLKSLSVEIEKVNESPFLAVLAQRDGTVTAIPVVVGETVQPGQPLVYLQPTGRTLLAEIYVHSGVMGKLAPGQEIMLGYDAFDFHSYGRYLATIKTIDRSALDARQHQLPIQQFGEPLFRVIAVPQQHYVEGEDIFPLQAGLLFTADFVSAEQSLIHYILKPLLDLRGKVS